MNINKIHIDLLYPGEPAVIEDKVNDIILGLENSKALESITITIIEGKYFVRDGNNRVRALLKYCSKYSYPIPKVEYKLSNEKFPTYYKNKNITHGDFLLYLGNKYGKGIEGFNEVKIVSEEEYTNISCRINQEFEKYNNSEMRDI